MYIQKPKTTDLLPSYHIWTSLNVGIGLELFCLMDRYDKKLQSCLAGPAVGQQLSSHIQRLASPFHFRKTSLAPFQLQYEISIFVCHLPMCSATPAVEFGDVLKVLAIFSDGSTHQRREYSKAQINGRCMIRFIRSQPRASNCKIQKTDTKYNHS